MQEFQKSVGTGGEDKVCYQRLAIKGFEWMETKSCEPLAESTNSKAFKNFKMDDQKKKWKKNKCKCFQGLGQKIKKVLQAKPKLKEQNTRSIKEQLYIKNLEQIEVKNNYKKILKSSKALQIYQQEKNLRAATINEYFDSQIKWINDKTKIF